MTLQDLEAKIGDIIDRHEYGGDERRLSEKLAELAMGLVAAERERCKAVVSQVCLEYPITCKGDAMIRRAIDGVTIPTVGTP